MAIAELRKISAGRNWDGSSNPRYRRNIPSPPNKADIAENAHLAGAEFNIACALPDHSPLLRFAGTALDLPSNSRLIG
jgi:hypothetical protein